jgi:transposase-like protein
VEEAPHGDVPRRRKRRTGGMHHRTVVGYVRLTQRGEQVESQVYERTEAWRNQPISGRFAYVYLDGIWLKRRW